MKRLKLYILLFCVALAAPLGYFVVRAHQGMVQEELAELTFFAEALFDEMEKELAVLVAREENRAVDDYFALAPDSDPDTVSPLSGPPAETYILGYLQNNPDGGYVTPHTAIDILVEDSERDIFDASGMSESGISESSDVGDASRSGARKQQTDLISLLDKVNEQFNIMRSEPEESLEKTADQKTQDVEPWPDGEEKENLPTVQKSVADKYLAHSEEKRQKSHLGREETNVQQITEESYTRAQSSNKFKDAESKKTEEVVAAAEPAPSPEDYRLSQESQGQEDKGEGEADDKPARDLAQLEEAQESVDSADIVVSQEEAAPKSSAREDSTSDFMAATGTEGGSDENEAQDLNAVAEQEPPAPKADQAEPGNAPGAGDFGFDGFADEDQDVEFEIEIADAETGQDQDENRTFRVEIDPLQSVIIDNEFIYVFRRIIVNNEVFRQGFVLKSREFLRHLAQEHFADQPMAQFTGLSLSVRDSRQQDAVRRTYTTGTKTLGPGSARFSLTRNFPRPFSFLQATLTCDSIPRSRARRTLATMSVALAAVILLGLFAIHRSASVVMDLSERRSGFVSSVTHELKTPLTNIRMYVEMLEQGIARDPEREQEYLRIVGSESARLSRLINNVLEFSKLENKGRRVESSIGTLDEVLDEVREVMREKLRQDGFSLEVELPGDLKPFAYNREVLVQVLINLMENSLKFGRSAPEKRITLRVRQDEDRTVIEVADTGPGIPAHALAKVFDDFYRVDNSLTRATRGTGIGLALVRRLVRAMGGKVMAANNAGPGCTIRITLPRSKTGEYIRSR